jgi:hypothetical protein
MTHVPPLAALDGAGTPDWRARRAAPDADEGLHERTFKWLACIPADLRPMATARRFPRIANRVAELWGHCEYSRLHFQSLLIDRRPGRRGFPPEVRRELEALQRYYFEALSALPAVLWNAVPVQPPRIPHRVFPWRPQAAAIEILPL